MGIKLAIVGATGLVGQELLRIIELGDYSIDTLGLYASTASAGTSIEVTGENISVAALDDCDFGKYDAALFSVGDELSAKFVPVALAAGCAVVDKSNAYRLDPDVPLVVPGVNDESITAETRLVANPNCTTIILAHALAPIKQKYGLTQVFTATYQSISGAGKSGVEQLFRELADSGYDSDKFRPCNPFEGKDPSEHDGCYTNDINELQTRIAHNVQPMIGRLDDTGRCGEEVKLIKESRKILGSPGLPFIVHSVRVPVPVGHSIAVTFCTAEPVDGFTELCSTLVCAANVDFGSSELDIPTPLNTAWHPFGNVEVGRLRREKDLENGWSMFVCGDNLRIGAALNGWRILELMADNGIVPEFRHVQGAGNG